MSNKNFTLIDSKFELKRLSVKSEYRRFGIGRSLVETVISQSKHLNGQTLVLSTKNVRQKAQRLYQSLGFEQKGSSRVKEGILQFFPSFVTGIVDINYELCLD